MYRSTPNLLPAPPEERLHFLLPEHASASHSHPRQTLYRSSTWGVPLLRHLVTPRRSPDLRVYRINKWLSDKPGVVDPVRWAAIDNQGYGNVLQVLYLRARLSTQINGLAVMRVTTRLLSSAPARFQLQRLRQGRRGPAEWNLSRRHKFIVSLFFRHCSV